VTAPRRARGRTDDPGPGLPGAGGATMRGALLIAVAVVVGFVLLAKGFEGGFLPTSSETPSEDAANDDEEPAEGEDGEEGTTTATTATPTTHAVAAVRVIVLNSTGPSGSAGAATETLAAAGYVTLDADDAGDQNVQVTAIYAQPGFEADAAAIATALGITAAPQPMPAPPPPPAPADANVVIVLGADFAPPA
jgi:hypothetical protein